MLGCGSSAPRCRALQLGNVEPFPPQKKRILRWLRMTIVLVGPGTFGIQHYGPVPGGARCAPKTVARVLRVFMPQVHPLAQSRTVHG